MRHFLYTLINMKKNLLAGIFLYAGNIFAQYSFPVIPQPVSATAVEGNFIINSNTYINTRDFGAFEDANVFRMYCMEFFNYPMKVTLEPFRNSNFIDLQYDSTLQIPDEGYILEISKDSIRITGKNKGGVLHGCMSLLQLMGSAAGTEENIFPMGTFSIPCGTITDYPRFAYRGMHLDCSRHFFDTDFIKRYIDYLCLYKMNTFHWHLTDDQGWRIEIRQYPLLTSVGAWRNGSMTGPYKAGQFDTLRYGGFYTQDEIRDIVQYASLRHVTIIPEIEMPGHCLAALASYPQYGCKDTSLQVGEAWGGYPDIFCPKEETFTFLEHILDEVMELFPSEYIHIGGDEVDKTRWKNSAYCQQLINEKGLQDAEGLQSYFVRRIEAYVNSKGRKIIGWDEILEGGIAPNATIMSWRGESGGISAANAHHNAIMTPGAYCYFDHYQGYPGKEPLAIGGYTPLEKVYHYNPVPQVLDTANRKYIIGAQGNVWTEYIKTPQQVEYMAIPRMLALSEVLWTPENKKDYDDFLQRLQLQFTMLDRIHCHYARSVYDITYTVQPGRQPGQLTVTLHMPEALGRISTDGGKTILPDGSYIDVKQDTGSFRIVAQCFATDKKIASGIADTLVLHCNKTTGQMITLLDPPSPKYAGDGAFTLVNGIQGITSPGWASSEWLGFSGGNLDATIDLGKTEKISEVHIGYLDDALSWIYIPRSVEVQVSDDGKNFRTVKTLASDSLQFHRRAAELQFEETSARYIRIYAENYGVIPDGKPGAGKKAWLFVDEIGIY